MTQTHIVVNMQYIIYLQAKRLPRRPLLIRIVVQHVMPAHLAARQYITTLQRSRESASPSLRLGSCQHSLPILA